VFENSALRMKLGPRRVAVQNCGENCIVRRSVLCIMAKWWLILGAEFCRVFFSGVQKFVQNVERSFEVKRLLWTYRCRWEHNIKVDFEEVFCDCEDCIRLAQDRD